MSQSRTLIESGQRVLFIGDSITACDRCDPVHAPLGWGFVRLFSEMQITLEPEKQISVINKGVHGNTISHLLSRWSDDVLEHQPNHLFILIGINDLTRLLDRSTSVHCAPEAFRNIYRDLVNETRTRLPDCRITLLESFFISSGDSISGSYRCRLIENLVNYRQATHEVAIEKGISVVPLQEIFDRLLSHRKSDVFSEDKIHPNTTGHFVIADAVYRSLLTENAQHV